MNRKFLLIREMTNSEKGALLLSLIIIIVIFAVLGAAILSITSTSTFTQVYGNHATKAYYMAESGYRYASMNIITISIGGPDCLKCHSSHGKETIRYSAGYARLSDDTIKVHGKTYPAEGDKDLLEGGKFTIRLSPSWFEFNAGDWNEDDKKLTVHAITSVALDPEVRCDFPEEFTNGTITIGGLYIGDQYVQYNSIDLSGVGSGTLIFEGVKDPEDDPISLTEGDVLPACLAAIGNPPLSKGGDLMIKINGNAKVLDAFPDRKSVIKIKDKSITYESVDRDNGKLTGLGNVHESEDVLTDLVVNENDVVILSKTLKITSTGRYPYADDADAAEKTLVYYRWVGEDITVPIVYNTSEPETDKLLAGGNFHWVEYENDNRGHNIFQDNVDDLEKKAPGDIGFAACGLSSCHRELSLGKPNDNGYSCHVCHFDPHPSKEEDDIWYRFLSAGAHDAGQGVEGIEHEKWNYGATANSHNEYLGKQQNGKFGFDGGLGNTTTAYCTGCHGEFHRDQKSGGQWIRHPSDWVIKNDGEFADAFAAGGSGTGTYDPNVPVARTSLAGGISNKVTLGSDMVMCLSCHQAHGSPYDDSLRWNTNSRDSSTNKCLTCHTQKTSSHHGESPDCRSCHTMHDGVVGLIMKP